MNFAKCLIKGKSYADNHTKTRTYEYSNHQYNTNLSKKIFSVNVIRYYKARILVDFENSIYINSEAYNKNCSFNILECWIASTCITNDLLKQCDASDAARAGDNENSQAKIQIQQV